MVYLHGEQLNERLVRHWANEIETMPEDPEGWEEYQTATYMIKQVETGINYVDATDILPCKYTYEIAKDEQGNPIPVDTPEVNEESQEATPEVEEVPNVDEPEVDEEVVEETK